MDEVGKRFSAGELFVPEMLMAAQAMKGGLEVLKPLLSGEGSSVAGHRGHRHRQGRLA
jgi:5-methyltetrahydrofolate--homocysteine methyltransferase